MASKGRVLQMQRYEDPVAKKDTLELSAGNKNIVHPG